MIITILAWVGAVLFAVGLIVLGLAAVTDGFREWKDGVCFIAILAVVAWGIWGFAHLVNKYDAAHPQVTSPSPTTNITVEALL
jgi:hypothetical protein